MLAEQLELTLLVGDRPDEHLLDASVSKGAELLGECWCGPDRKPLPEDVLRPVDGRHEPLAKDPVGFGDVVGDVEPHGRERVREGVAVLALGGKELLKPSPGDSEFCRCGVVGRRQPAVGETGHPPQPGLGAPAAKSRSVDRSAVLDGAPTRSPRSSRTGRRTVHRRRATTPAAHRSPRRSVATVPRNRGRPRRSRPPTSPDPRPPAADPPTDDRSRPRSWRVAPVRAPLPARPSSPASSPPSAPSPPPARPAHPAIPRRTPCGRSPRAHESRVAQPLSCTR